MNFDLFPTLLELTGVAPPDVPSRALSLLAPRDERPRLAEEPAYSKVGLGSVVARHPGWDPSPWRRRQRALLGERYKYIWSSKGEPELYDLVVDPEESDDLAAREPELRARMAEQLERYHASLAHCEPPPEQAPAAPTSPTERSMLKALGYLAEDEE
jgi:arylsulfatase A-like enzyme